MLQPTAKTPLTLAAVLGVALLSACAEKPATTEKAAKKALAVMNATAGNNVQGKIALTERSDGVDLQITLTGLQPDSEHGFHVHENGDCSAADGKSAGGHYAPGNMQHGAPGDAKRHEGDLGNIMADSDGRVTSKKVDKRITLSGPNTVVGKAFIVHAGADDFTSQPSGAAGARVACGVIKASN